MSDFLERARRHADAEGRLPIGGMAQWEVFPYEVDGLRARPLTEYEVPEPDRTRTPEACGTCKALARDDLVLFVGERLAVIRPGGCNLPFVANVVSRRHETFDDLDESSDTELGRLVRRTYQALKALDDIGNVNVNKWENGGGHLSVSLLARPLGVLQLRGSNLAAWTDMLPPTPEVQLAAHAETVRALLKDQAR